MNSETKSRTLDLIQQIKPIYAKWLIGGFLVLLVLSFSSARNFVGTFLADLGRLRVSIDTSLAKNIAESRFVAGIDTSGEYPIYSVNKPQRGTQEARFATGEVLVKFKNRKLVDEAEARKKTSKNTLKLPSSTGITQILENFDVDQVEKPFTKTKSPKLQSVVLLKSAILKNGKNGKEKTKSLLQTLQNSPEIEYAELNFRIETFQNSPVQVSNVPSCNLTWGTPILPDGRGLRKIGDKSDVKIEIFGFGPNIQLLLRNTNTDKGGEILIPIYTDENGNYVIEDHTEISSAEYFTGSYITEVIDTHAQPSSLTSCNLGFVILDTNPPPEELVNDSSCFIIKAPKQVSSGQTFNTTVGFTNTGTKTWTGLNPFESNSSGIYKLGSQNPEDNLRWGLGRVDLQGPPVKPGENTLFVFEATAPNTIGSYPFEWKMVEEFVEWFGGVCRQNISVSNTPNDKFYSSTGSWGQIFRDLWGLVKISAEKAWSVSQGSDAVVAIIDTGIDYNHPDIATNIWTNSGEIGTDSKGNDKKSNGIDDDNNGYVDDWRGYDFTNYDYTYPDNDPLDEFGHGTHVAGTVAAIKNNEIGIVGVAPKSKVMALQGLNRNGYGYISDLVEAIIYAADNGADVINASWGGWGFSQSLIDAINYAHDTKGVVFVAAAGNNNSYFEEGYGFIPANIKNVITVSASDENDNKAYFSNFGAKIDVTAPGGGERDFGASGIFDSFRTILSLKSEVISDLMTGFGRLIIGENYVRQAGTSMAAPHVAGVAALIRSLHPQWSPEQVRQAIRLGSDDIDNPGFDLNTGYGRLNAERSLQVPAPLTVRITSPESGKEITGLEQIIFSGYTSGPNFSHWALEYGLGNVPDAWYQIAVSEAPTGANAKPLASWDITSVPDGHYTIRLISANTTGQKFEDRIQIVINQVVITDPPASRPTDFFEQITAFRVGDKISIRGTVMPARFESFSIMIQKASDFSELQNSKIKLVDRGLKKINSNLLGTWDTQGVPSDHYQINIRVNLSDGQTVWGRVAVKVMLDASLHVGWPINLGDAKYGGFPFFTLSDVLTTADINANGREEILIGNGKMVNIFDHTGNLLPGWGQSIDPYNYGAVIQSSPAAGDLDGDGKPEVVAGNNQGLLFVWKGDGTLLPGWPKQLSSYVNPPVLEDIDGDGVREIIVTDWWCNIYVFDKNAQSLPGWPKSVSESEQGSCLPSVPVVGDLDNDGKKEIALINRYTPINVYVFNHKGENLKGWPKKINPETALDSFSFSNPVFGDLDGDRDLEIAIGTPEGYVYVFNHDGSSLAGWPKFTKNGYEGNPLSVNTPAIGDLDGDGRNELVAGIYTDYSSYPPANYLYAWRGDGSVMPAWPIRIDLPANNFGLYGQGAPVIVDLDRDGKAEVITSSDVVNYSPHALNAYRVDGSNFPGFPKPTKSLGAWPANTAAIADIDGDGLLEIAWVDFFQNMYVWDLEGSAQTYKPWPMFQRDAQHTGTLPPTTIIKPPLDTTPPNVTLNSPQNNSEVKRKAKVTISATATDNIGVKNVTLYVNGNLLCTIKIAPYSCVWNVPNTNNTTYVLQAKAMDEAGNTGLSNLVNVKAR